MQTMEDLKALQALPLERKVLATQTRLIEWYNHWDGQVYVSFSGGVDSTVLLHITRKMFPDTKAMFVNTGLEFPEIQRFVRSFDNVDIIRPKMRFDEVIKKYGYPIIGKEVAHTVHYAKKGKSWAINYLNGLDAKGEEKRYYKSHYSQWKWLLDTDFPIGDQCCYVMKKSPAHTYAKQTGRMAIVATMTEESVMRQQNWLRYGCNSFEQTNPTSKPMSFWTRQDVLKYIVENNLDYCSVYGDIVLNEDTGLYETTGVDRTGCVFCCFGVTHDAKPNRFEQLKLTHPRQYEYCINGGGYQDGIWLPNQEGLGLGYVLNYLGVEY